MNKFSNDILLSDEADSEQSFLSPVTSSFSKDTEAYCSNCKFKKSCAIRIDYPVDTCDEHEFK